MSEQAYSQTCGEIDGNVCFMKDSSSTQIDFLWALQKKQKRKKTHKNKTKK